MAAPDGGLDRGAIASRVFESSEDREWLEGLLWPRVGRRVVEFRTEVDAKHPPARAAVVEVPLLFEAGMQDVFDHTVAVIADEDVRAERAGGRGHEGLEGRAGRQLSQDGEVAACGLHGAQRWHRGGVEDRVGRASCKDWLPGALDAHHHVALPGAGPQRLRAAQARPTGPVASPLTYPQAAR